MKSFLAGALVATIVSAGVTYAVASGSTDTVQACAHKKTGDLRIMTGKKCKKSERRVSWPAESTQAAQGATGPKGDAGATGPAGSNGLSAAYNGHLEGVVGSTFFAPVGYVDLPAGSYVLTATMIMAPFQSDSTVTVRCKFGATGDTWGPHYEHPIDVPENGGTITMQINATLANSGRVEVLCKKNPYSSGVDVIGYIYAIAVDTLNIGVPT